MFAGVFVFLSGCVISDAPRGLAGLHTIYGVKIVSATSPYHILSVTHLPPVNRQSAVWTERALHRESQLIAKGDDNNWRWSVWATPDLLKVSHRLKKNSQSSNCGKHPCHRSTLSWNVAFRRLYVTAAYLLGKPPLPMDVRVNLVAEGQGVETRVSRRSSSQIPLEFTFWYPNTAVNQMGYRTSRIHALVRIVSTVAYEFQHVEYTAGDTAGPTSLLQARTFLKDEANSTCWAIATRLTLRPNRWPLRPVSRTDLQSDAQVYGAKLHLRTAAFWGPVLLRHDLGQYLAESNPASQPPALWRVATMNRLRVNRVLAYCRGFTHYDGSIVKHAMPLGDVSKHIFWK